MYRKFRELLYRWGIDWWEHPKIEREILDELEVLSIRRSKFTGQIQGLFVNSSIYGSNEFWATLDHEEIKLLSRSL